MIERFWRAYSVTVVRLRWAVVAAWLAAVLLATTLLPSLEHAQTAPLGGLVIRDSPALAAAERSYELFRFPVLADTAVVQRNPEGLSVSTIASAAERAAFLTRTPDPDATGIALVAPIPNVGQLFPRAAEDGTTIVTYLFVRPDRSQRNRVDLAHLFAARYLSSADDSLVGVTGATAAQLEQARIIRESLPRVESATVALLGVIVAIAFRSLVAPLITLAAAGVAFLVATRALGALGQLFDVAVPREVEPLIVVLLLAIVTDYCIFFLADARERLRVGTGRRDAAVATTAHTAHIVAAAGLIVAAGTATLLAGKIDFFRVFGPGLAFTAIVGVVVAITLVPALLALLGRATFWPLGLERSTVSDQGQGTRRAGSRLTRVALRRPWLTLLVTAAPLVALAVPLAATSLGVTLIRGLPSDSEPRIAAGAASAGFAPGILSPTEVVVEGAGVAERREQLAAFESSLEGVRGVAAVFGPREDPIGGDLGASLSPTGNAARFVLILDIAPLSGPGIDRLRAIEARLPALLRAAGLDDARASTTGATTLAAETVDGTLGDLRRIALAAGIVNLLLLVLLLRAVVAPIFLLLTSVLTVAASLGLATLVFQEWLHFGDLTYFVPFVSSVLLVSLGSDYNVFMVGRIWQAAKKQPMRDAVLEEAPRAARALTAAGLALALSFALLALVPLRPFRELAFVLCVGVLLETFVVRSGLVPALLSIFGRVAGWPGLRPDDLAPRSRALR